MDKLSTTNKLLINNLENLVNKGLDSAQSSSSGASFQYCSTSNKILQNAPSLTFSVPTKTFNDEADVGACKRVCKGLDYFSNDEFPSITLETQSTIKFECLQLHCYGKPTTQKENKLQKLKQKVLNVVTSSMVNTAVFRKNVPNTAEEQQNKFMELLRELKCIDPEFILKVALYCRRELGIRSAANFIVAFAVSNPECCVFLKKYYKAVVCLPSDWMDVAEIYQERFGNKFPAAFRKSMVKKFKDFDAYQLAKYNRSHQKKSYKANQAKKKALSSDQSSDSKIDSSGTENVSGAETGIGDTTGNESAEISPPDSSGNDSGVINSMGDIVGTESEDEVFIHKTYEKKISLQSLIRILHISEPVDHVLCLLGKKYPVSEQDFMNLGLPGQFDAAIANKRMKLPTPSTWETLLSATGNTPETWEWLLDNRKIPYVALMRNIRNLLLVGITVEHHTKASRYLSSETAVIKNKQFPVNYYKVFDVINQIESKVKDTVNNIKIGLTKKSYKLLTKKEREDKFWYEKRHMLADRGKNPEEMERIIEMYRSALNLAILHSAKYNVPPIPGSTLLICYLGPEMLKSDEASRSIFQTQVGDPVLILSLMAYSACEYCEFMVYGNSIKRVIPSRQSLMDNLSDIKSHVKDVNNGETFFSHDGSLSKILEKCRRDQVWIDTIILLPKPEKSETSSLPAYAEELDYYRTVVNPNLLFVNINADGGSNFKFSKEKTDHENDIYLSGISDQVLSFIAERGSASQISYVEGIDKKYELSLKLKGNVDISKPVEKIEYPISDILKIPKWRTVRTFISSTFRDMHGERDLLTRFVFPRLVEKAQCLFISLREVDLRWGISQQEADEDNLAEICLREVDKCDLFLGILGERYGWIPGKYPEIDEPQFEWLKSYPSGSSLTQLEIQHATLNQPNTMRNKAFFFFRNSDASQNASVDAKSDFLPETTITAAKMTSLKEQILSRNLEVFENYPAYYGGLVDGKYVMKGLEEFGQRVFNSIWNALITHYPVEEVVVDEITHEAMLQEQFALSICERNIPRTIVNRDCKETLDESENSSVILITGKHGCGMTTVMGSLYGSLTGATVVPYFVGASPLSINPTFCAFYLCSQLNNVLNLNCTVGQDHDALIAKFPKLLEEAKQKTGRLILLLDGLDNCTLPNKNVSFDWIIPDNIPKGVSIILSGAYDSVFAKYILTKENIKKISIGNLEISERKCIVEMFLEEHEKKLDEAAFNNQMQVLTAKRDAGSPLYLKLACEELRLFGLFDELGTKLTKLGTTLESLIQDILKRLEEDLSPQLVESAFCILLVQKEGVTEGDLYKLINLVYTFRNTRFTVAEVASFVKENKNVIPYVHLSKLLLGMKAFLHSSCREGQENAFFLASQDIIKIASSYFFSGMMATKSNFYHKILAGYFYHVVMEGLRIRTEGIPAPIPVQALETLPYHLTVLGEMDVLKDVLCNLRFIEARATTGTFMKILEDFEVTNATFLLKEKFLTSSRVKEYKSFISKNMHVIKRSPILTLQQALNEPDTSVINISANKFIQENNCDFIPLYCTESKALQPVRTLDDFPTAVTVIDVWESEKLAAGTEQGVIQIFKFHTGEEIRTLSGHGTKITALCFLNASQLCSGAEDGLLSVWDITKGHRTTSCQAHLRQLTDIALSPTGLGYISVGWDGVTKLWNQANFSETSVIKEKKPINCIAFHPQKPIIALGCWNSLINLWNIVDIKRVGKLQHNTSVQSVQFSSCGEYLVSASMFGYILIWNWSNYLQIGCLYNQHSTITSIALSHDKQFIFAGNKSGDIKVWSSHLGRPIVHIEPLDQKGHVCIVSAILIGGDGNKLFVGHPNGLVRNVSYSGTWQKTNWETYLGTECISIIKHFQDTMLIIAMEEIVAIVESESGVILIHHGEYCGKVNGVSSFENTIVTGSMDGIVRILLYDEGNFESRLILKYQLHGHKGPIYDVAINWKALYLASVGQDKELHLWQSTVSNKITEWKEVNMNHWSLHLAAISCCAWFKGETEDQLITGSEDGTVRLWNCFSRTDPEMTLILSQQAAVVGLIVQDNYVSCVTSDGSVFIVSMQGVTIMALPVEAGTVASFWIPKDVPQAKLQRYVRLVVAKTDISVLLVFNGISLGTLHGHTQAVTDLKCLKDGLLVSSSANKSVCIWKPENIFTKSVHDIAKLEMSNNIVKSHHGLITCMDVSVDGKYVVSGSKDGLVVVWGTTPTWKQTAAFKPHMMQLLTSEKQSKKVESDNVGISSLRFTHAQGFRICIGSENGVVYTVVVPPKSTHGDINVIRVMDLSHPANCMHWNPEFPEKLLLAQTLGHTMIYHIDVNFLGSIVTHDHTTWPVHISHSFFSDSDIHLTDNNGVIHLYQCDKKSLQDLDLKELSTRTLPLTHLATESGQRSEWACESIVIGGRTFTVTNIGNLFIASSQDDIEFHQIHHDSITVILLDPKNSQLFYTASLDGYLKVWKYSEDAHLTQVGQFSGATGPITTLVASATNNVVTLYIGTREGCIHTLKRFD